MADAGTGSEVLLLGPSPEEALEEYAFKIWRTPPSDLPDVWSQIAEAWGFPMHGGNSRTDAFRDSGSPSGYGEAPGNAEVSAWVSERVRGMEKSLGDLAK